MVSLLQDEVRKRERTECFRQQDFLSDSFQNRYSDYRMGGVRDQLAFYYDNADYEMFLRFFTFLESRAEFTFEQYQRGYKKFSEFVLNNHPALPAFVESEDRFLQFLYDTNIICYIENTEIQELFRWC